MSVTQAVFERTLQENLERAGFDLNLKDVRELLDIVGSTIVGCLTSEMKEAGKLGWGKARASSNGKVSNPAVRVRAMGTFRVNWRPAGFGRNPATGERIKTKASKRMKMLPAKAMRDTMGVK